MPSEKRQRQRQMRQVRVAAEERHRSRRRRVRRGLSALVVAGLVVGVIFWVSSSSTPKKKAASKTSTTNAVSSTTSPSTAKTTTTANPAAGPTSTSSTPSTAPVSHEAVAPTCPPATSTGAPTRVIAFTKAPPMCVTPGATYLATVQTDVGTFTITMPVKASKAAVNNFVFLARNHFFDGIVFHRVIPGFVVQGGDPTGTGTGGPGYTFTGNTPPANCQPHCYKIGSVAMANSNSSPKTDGSQFFIVVGSDGTSLPGDYTLFGQVSSGMSVVNKIAADGTSSGTPKVTHRMVKVTVARIKS